MNIQVQEDNFTLDKEMRRLKKIKISLMRHEAFAMLTGIMMVGKTSLSDTFPSAYTNGRDEVYGRGFMKQLTDKMVGFVIVHENFHKMYRHTTIWAKLWKKNPKLANLACDYVINLQIVACDPNETIIAFPMKNGERWGAYDLRFKGMHVKQVFDILEKEQEEGGDKGDEGEEGFDEHGWEEAEGLSEEDKKELEREIDQGIRQGVIAQQKIHGKGAGGGLLDLGDLLKPKVDWREQLREFVKAVYAGKDKSSWRKVNKRFIGEDIYLPSLVGERVGPVLIGGDTSGSVDQVGYMAAISEVDGIMNMMHPEKVHMLYWGSSVVAHEEYDDANMGNFLSSTRPINGGGTEPNCVSKYMKDKHIKVECVIHLTDGCIGDWGKAEDYGVPVLWVIIGEYGKDIVAPFGKTIHIPMGGE